VGNIKPSGVPGGCIKKNRLKSILWPVFFFVGIPLGVNYLASPVLNEWNMRQEVSPGGYASVARAYPHLERDTRKQLRGLASKGYLDNSDMQVAIALVVNERGSMSLGGTAEENLENAEFTSNPYSMLKAFLPWSSSEVVTQESPAKLKLLRLLELDQDY
jgi:hypothetical protein